MIQAEIQCETLVSVGQLLMHRAMMDRHSSEKCRHRRHSTYLCCLDGEFLTGGRWRLTIGARGTCLPAMGSSLAGWPSAGFPFFGVAWNVSFDCTCAGMPSRCCKQHKSGQGR